MSTITSRPSTRPRPTWRRRRAPTTPRWWRSPRRPSTAAPGSSASDSQAPAPAAARSLRLELHVLVRRRIGVAGDQPQTRLLHPGPVAVDERELPDRDEHRLLVHDLLDLVQQRLALLAIQLGSLILEERIDLRIAAVDIGTAGDDEGLQARRRVAKRAARRVREVLVLLVAVAGPVRGALDRPQLGPDAELLQIVRDRLLHVRVRDVQVVFAGVEAVGVARLGQELLGLRGIERIGRRLPVEIEGARNDAVRQPGVAEGDGLVDRLAVDRQVGGQTHPTVVPGGFRIPLVQHAHPLRRLDDRRFQDEPRAPLQLFGELAADRIDDVDLAALERRQAGRLVADHLEDEALHVRRLAPVAVERLQHELDARRERYELVGTGADRGLLEALVADLV